MNIKMKRHYFSLIGWTICLKVAFVHFIYGFCMG